MRPTSQRGSATVAVLVITIILLLAFVVMWFMEKGDREKAQAAEKTAIASQTTASEAAAAYRDAWAELSRIVGWTTVSIADRYPKYKEFSAGAVATDIAAVQGNLTPDGTVPGPGGTTVPGLTNKLRNETSISLAVAQRAAKGPDVTEAKADFGWMKPELRQKIQQVATLRDAVGNAPAPPVDSDDAAAVAQYNADLAAYETRMKEFSTAVEELTKVEGYKKYSEIAKIPGALVDEQGAVELKFFGEAPRPYDTLADLLLDAPKPFERLKAQFIAEKTNDAGIIARTTEEKTQLDAQLVTANKSLSEEQGRHTTDTTNLQKEVTDANAKVEENRLTATNAQNALAKEQEDRKREVATLSREVQAREERIRQEKARRDLAVRRDDPDGSILGANNSMRTATIDLGHADKVFPGQKFTVSRIGRGAIRENVGQVMVSRVTGTHASQVAILAEDMDAPISAGDIIANPFYSPTETIHVWFAGDVERYPKHIAREKLARMGVIVDDQLGAQTDYVVIPNSMSAPAEPAAPAEGEGGAAPAVGKSELERIESQARTFGATVITENVLNSFLDY